MAVSRALSLWSHLDPPLARFIRVNLLCVSASLVGLGLAIAAGFRHRDAIIDLVVMTAALAVMLASEVLSRRWGGAQTAVFGLVASASLFAFGAVWITPYLVPLSVLVLLIPNLGAITYLTRGQVNFLAVYAIVGTAAVGAIAELRRPIKPPDTPVVGAIVVASSLPFVILVVAFAVRQSFHRLLEQARQLHETQTAIVEVADAARRSIERDIHDGAQQHLLAMSLRIGRARRAAADGDQAVVAGLLDELSGDAMTTLHELRELARGVYPTLLAEKGLVAAIESAARRSTIPVTVEAQRIGRLPTSVENAAYFCVLEALSNAVKHSGCKGIVVAIAREGLLSFSVTDDGSGFDPTTVRRSGLLGMQARIQAAGGQLKVVSTPGGGGTAVRVRFDLPSERPVVETDHWTPLVNDR